MMERAAQPANVRYRALAWLTAAAGLAYLCRNAIGVPESAIREELGLTFRQSGWFMAHSFGVTPFSKFRADGSQSGLEPESR